jgi:hypothetical protein
MASCSSGLASALRETVARLNAGKPIHDILRQCPSVALAYDRRGGTLLHKAARLGRADAVWALTYHGAAPESIDLAGNRAVPLDAPAYVLAAVAPNRPRLVMM